MRASFDRWLAVTFLTMIALVFGHLSSDATNTGAAFGYAMLCVFAVMSAGILVFELEDKL